MTLHACRAFAAAAVVWWFVTTAHVIRAMQSAATELPPPTGPHAVGTTTWRLADATRTESFAPEARREIQVLAWYPTAVSDGTRAPYLRGGPGEARAFATLLRAPGGFDHVAAFRTHATLDAPPDAKAGPLPLLLFSHGYTSAGSAYTALLEDLASHGYAVLSIIHPYEAMAATMGDGRSVSMLDADNALRQPIRDVLAEWELEDKTMAAVTKENVPARRDEILRGYLQGLKKTGVMLQRWVDDTRLALDRLATLPENSIAGRLARQIDTARIGAFGHSMGGVTSGQFCVEDSRCRAGLNLDGIPQYGSMIDRPLNRPFLMVYSARPGRLGASDTIYRRAASPYYRVDVRDTLHVDFSDFPFWAGPLRERGAMGSLPAEHITAITRAIVREYFDQALRGRRSTLLAGAAMFPEVTVTVSGTTP
jgi:dienelactone hydrolase